MRGNVPRYLGAPVLHDYDVVFVYNYYYYVDNVLITLV